MSRLSTVVWVAVFVVAAFLLYMVKYRVQTLQTQIADMERQLEEEREALHVAAAEWAYLTRPERLHALASKYLSATDMTVDRIAEIEAIPFPRQTEASVVSSQEDIQPVSAKIQSGTGAER